MRGPTTGSAGRSRPPWALGAFLVLAVWLLLDGSGAAMPDGIPYAAKIQGAPKDPPEVENLLGEVSQTLQKRNQPIASVALLERRAEADIAELKKVLRSFGYFRSRIQLRVQPPKSGVEKAAEEAPYGDQGEIDLQKTAKTPAAAVSFHIQPGPRFTFHKPVIRTAPDTPATVLAPPLPADVGIADQSPYAARRVVDAGEQILTYYRQRGYPFPKISHRDVVADFKANTVTASFQVAPGPEAGFGPVKITGLTRLEPAYVRALIPWKRGDKYDSRRIQNARRILFDTNLFSAVQFIAAQSVSPDGLLPMTIDLKERAPRTIRLGAEYTTDYGPGVNAGWTHRNLFGMAEKLSATAIFNSKIRTAGVRFDKPMFMGIDNSLVAQGAFNDESSDAYDSTSVDISAVLERQFNKDYRAGGGFGVRTGRVKQEGDASSTSYTVFYIPLTAVRDTRRDVLNPTRGYQLSLSVAPYQGVRSTDLRFFRYLFSGSTYYNFHTGDRIVAAIRGAFGQILGEHHNEVPADLRFYAGGGGSIRGYAYQLAGPLRGNTPLGGLSVLEFSLEMRFKITESVGLVPFLDGGTAFFKSVPDFEDQEILLGAGLGLRYFTGIGPIRLDVATPLRKREGVDSTYQIYVSIGQAF